MKTTAMMLAMMVLGSLTGCSDTLDSKTLIKRVRIVGVKTEVVGDAIRATPSAGESIDATVHVVHVAERMALQWLFVPCVPEFSAVGIPICARVLDCEGCVATAGSIDDPVVRFTVPDEADLDGVDELLLAGVVCAGGATVSLADLLAIASEQSDEISACADRALQGEFLATSIPLQVDDQTNARPTVDRTFFSGIEWPDIAAPNDPAEGCRSAAIRTVRVQEASYAITLSVPAGTAETFTTEDMNGEEETRTEEIQVSWHGTAGDFDRSFTFLGDGASLGSVAWQTPQTVTEDGELVRFHFVIRDGRGGTDWVERALCVLP